MNKEQISQMLEIKKQREVGRYLRQFRKGQRLPQRIFETLLGAIPASSMEIVPFYKSEDKIFVFMTKRNDSDPHFPGMWHCPGTMILNFDLGPESGFSKPWNRLKLREFNDPTLPDPVFVEKKHYPTKRGNEIALIHYVEIRGDYTHGSYFLAESLPENIVPHHKDMIKEALMVYTENNVR